MRGLIDKLCRERTLSKEEFTELLHHADDSGLSGYLFPFPLKPQGSISAIEFT